MFLVAYGALQRRGELEGDVLRRTPADVADDELDDGTLPVFGGD
jgi:hypothetical protein